jgi:hypothetical protein
VDPAQAGRVVIAITVDASGSVADSHVAMNDGLCTEVATCIADVARKAHFDPPHEGQAAINVVFNFVKVGTAPPAP